MKKYNRNKNPLLNHFIDQMDLLFNDEPDTPVHTFSCGKCKKKHQMDLVLYQQTVQRSRLVVHCPCGNAVEVM